MRAAHGEAVLHRPWPVPEQQRRTRHGNVMKRPPAADGAPVTSCDGSWRRDARVRWITGEATGLAELATRRHLSTSVRAQRDTSSKLACHSPRIITYYRKRGHRVTLQAHQTKFDRSVAISRSRHAHKITPCDCRTKILLKRPRQLRRYQE